ncbi:MAG: glutathione gamma-glutamylcysteinyltransferase [Deltaproteobacteria bacterium]|nr:MAG: glutathione gamma-glutamylcysteinyltransferase [Deltaproteobacteria bacterium]
MSESPQQSKSRWFVGLCVVVLIILVGLAGSAYSILTSQPKGPRRPLAKGQIPLPSKEGQRLLQESQAKVMFKTLQKSLQTQQRPAYCGVASSVSTLNAINPKGKLTQTSFFHSNARKVVGPFWVTLRGMTLDELASSLKSHKVKVKQHFASDNNLKTFRKLAQRGLQTQGSVVVVAYSRKKLKQIGSGHISPLGAYHAKSDRFLVMDVATYKYPPHWVKASKLWAAINTVDPSTKKTRGFLLVSSQHR